MIIDELIDFPNQCRISRTISKKDIYEAANLKSKDKNNFNIIKQVKICYNFNEDNIRIPPYKTDEKDYDEIQVINVNLNEEKIKKINLFESKTEKKLNKIVKIILRIIPYPIILSMQYKSYIKFFGSHISESKSDSSKITLDEVLSTKWMNYNNLGEFEHDFISKIQIKNLDYTNFFTFYNSYITAIIQYDGALTVGGIVDKSPEEIQEVYRQIELIDKEIRSLEKDLDEETQFNKQMELDMKLDELDKKKEDLQEKLRC